jgi:ABC-type uncharacterized transport system substrate-binding protein
MRRREFVTLIGSAAAAWPLAARAQQAHRIRRIGLLMNLSENDVEAQRLITAFRKGLAQLGWTDGRNLRIDDRWAGGDVGQITTYATELVELSPDIIVGYGTPVVVALQQRTRRIEQGFCSGVDFPSVRHVMRKRGTGDNERPANAQIFDEVDRVRNT